MCKKKGGANADTGVKKGVGAANVDAGVQEKGAHNVGAANTIVDYRKFVENLNLHGTRRKPMRRTTSPKLSKWKKIGDARGIEFINGFDDMPLRELDGEEAADECIQIKVSTSGEFELLCITYLSCASSFLIILFVIALMPGVVWDLRVPGGITKMCCLMGFQCGAHGVMYVLCMEQDLVERFASIQNTDDVVPLLEQCHKISVTDLFQHGKTPTDVKLHV